MTSQKPAIDAAVAAFRELTAAASDGEATRLRVLSGVAQRAHRPVVLRRALTAGLAGLIIIATGSAAWTAVRGWWDEHTPARAVLAFATVEAVRLSAGHPRRAIPVMPEHEAGDQADDDAETAAYGRAHRAHFVDDLPARALGAWDAYLAAYPRGPFAPEARFNRALCLVRLARWTDAARALGPFARGDGYRRQEACTLLGWLRDRSGDPTLAAGGCEARADLIRR